jgi:hypothetical protein
MTIEVFERSRSFLPPLFKQTLGAKESMPTNQFNHGTGGDAMSIPLQVWIVIRNGRILEYSMKSSGITLTTWRCSLPEEGLL